MSSVVMLVFVDYSLVIMNSAYLTHSAVPPSHQSMLVDQQLLRCCHHNFLVGCATFRGLTRMR